jgi:hypothetical protein
MGCIFKPSVIPKLYIVNNKNGMQGNVKLDGRLIKLSIGVKILYEVQEDAQARREKRLVFLIRSPYMKKK